MAGWRPAASADAHVEALMKIEAMGRRETREGAKAALAARQYLLARRRLQRQAAAAARKEA